MELQDMITLIKAVSESSLTQFTVEDRDFKLCIKTDRQAREAQTPKEEEFHQPNPLSEAEASSRETAGHVVEAPLVGIFHDAPSAEGEAFVKKGDRVRKGQVLGIIEAMKMMNEVESQYDGVVTDICIEDGMVTEYGQPLFVIA